MKKFILLLCMSLVALVAYSQKENTFEGRTTKGLDQQQKDEQRKAEKEATAISVKSMVTNRQFYLEVNFMSDESRAFSQSAGMIDVSSQMNYIAIDSNKIIMQVVPNTYLTTNWGIENLPIRGTFLQYKLSKLEKSDEGYFIRFRTIGQIGGKDIFITVQPNGKADLRMVKNNGETLNFRGVLIPLNQSRITAIFL
jgi:predicted chitinase